MSVDELSSRTRISSTRMILCMQYLLYFISWNLAILRLQLTLKFTNDLPSTIRMLVKIINDLSDVKFRSIKIPSQLTTTCRICVSLAQPLWSIAKAVRFGNLSLKLNIKDIDDVIGLTSHVCMQMNALAYLSKFC